MLLVDDLAAGGTKNLRHTPRGLVTLYTSHLNYVQLYETLHLEMAAHFQKVTETGP